MNTIALVLPTYKANMEHLHQALGCSDLFDEVIVHVNDEVTMKQLVIPKNVDIIYDSNRCPVTTALNFMIESIESSYVLAWTDDDIFYRDNLIKVLDYVRNCSKIDVLHYPIKVGTGDKWRTWGIDKEITFDKLSKKNMVPFSSIYNKEVWQKVKGYKDVPFSDWLFWLEVAKAGFKFEYIDYTVYAHRQGHKETLSMKESKPYSLNKIKEIFRKEMEKQ